MNYEIWTPVTSGSFVRKHDITQWVLAGTAWDVRLIDLPAGRLIVDRSCPHLDDILFEDRDDHTNDVGSTLMIYDDGTWVGAMVPTEREDETASDDSPVVFTLEGLERFLDRAVVEPYDHPADPIREGDWIYGHPTILTPAGGEISDARWSLYVDGATSGSYTITDGTDTTSAITYNESDPSTIKTRLETDITAITEVAVSGAGTSANEFFIRLTDPSGTDLSLSVNDSTNGTVVLSKTTTGGTPSPRPWHGSLDGNTGDVIGTYQSFEMVTAGSGSVPSAPTPYSGTTSTYLLKVDADTPAGSADYAGAQVEVSVIPGHRYRGKIQVYSETAQRIRFIIRTLTEYEIASDDVNVSADTWTELDVAFTVPDGVETVVYRVGIVEDGNADIVYMDVNDAIFAPGVDEANFGEICNDLLAPIQTRSVLDWWTETFGDVNDSSSEAWDRDLNVRVRRGQSFMQWLEYGSRWGYERSTRWTGSAWNLGLYNPGNLGTDYTGQGGPTVSPFDGGILGSPYLQRIPDFTTAIAEGDAGTWGEYTDANLATGWGRLEGYFANRQNAGSLDALATQMVTDSAAEAVSHRITVLNPVVRPLSDVKVGDTVPVLVRKPSGSMDPELHRVVMISVEETDAGPVFEYHFGSPIFDAERADAEAMRQLIRRYQALDNLGDGRGTVEPLFVSSPVPSTALEANAGELASQVGIYSLNSDSTGPHTWELPTGIVEGDKIIVSVQVYDTTETIDTMPSGYTEIENTLLPSDSSGSAGRFYVFEKDADGTEEDGVFTLTGGAKVVLISKRIAANGNTLPQSTIEASGTESLNPPPITPSTAGLYAVTIFITGQNGSPSPDGAGATPSGYEFQAYESSEAATSRPRIYMAQRSVQITTNEDPGEVGWTVGVDASFTILHAFTMATRLDSGTADVAAGDHTHVEADVTDLDHWTEADHDALDHTGLTGVGGDVTVAKAGTEIGTRGRINFIEGTDITLTVTDDSGNDEIDVTVTSTASGGGGSSTVPEWIELLAAPDSAHGDDQEFTGTIGGTAVTPTGTVTWTQDNGVLSAGFEDQSSTDQCPRLYALTPSSAPVTIETRMRLLARRAANPMLGLMFADGTTASDSAVSVGLYQGANGAPIVARWSGTITSMGTTNLFSDLPFGILDSWIYMRLIWTASNTWAWALSPDGVSWTDFGASTFAATLTPTHFGPFVSSWNITYPIVGSFEYVRVTESDLSV